MSIRASQVERTRELPGDHLVPQPKLATTHAISIDATAEKVWPWLVQMGQGRGGFYSYTLFENLLGCRMKNADRIHAEWQQVSIGETVGLHPKAAPLRVAAIEEHRHFVLQSTAGFPWTWAFIIAVDGAGCRLLVRTRVSWSSPFLSLVLRPVMGPGHFIMERRMLLGIKSRAEKSPSAG